jgi:hypothetical protein
VIATLSSTVIESRRRRGINSFAYLRDIFTHLPPATNWQAKDLTPETDLQHSRRKSRH